MDVNAAVAAAAAIAGVLTGVIAMLAFRWSERDQKRPTRTSLHTDPVLPPGVDTVLSVLRSSAVVLDEADAVVKASSAAYALGLVDRKSTRLNSSHSSISYAVFCLK